MRHSVVEGEPGIFPDPVARVVRALGGLFSRKRRPQPASTPPPQPTETEAETGDAE